MDTNPTKEAIQCIFKQGVGGAGWKYSTGRLQQCRLDPACKPHIRSSRTPAPRGRPPAATPSQQQQLHSLLHSEQELRERFECAHRPGGDQHEVEAQREPPVLLCRVNQVHLLQPEHAERGAGA